LATGAAATSDGTWSCKRREEGGGRREEGGGRREEGGGRREEGEGRSDALNICGSK
jgi:hypothetical protein